MLAKPTIHWPIAGLLATVAAAGCSTDVLRSRATNTDEFVQNAAAMVDILWVVDNSGSMQEEQQGLGESFAAFIQNLIASGVNYHIGVISTDVADGGQLHTGAGMPPFIDNDTPNAESTFLANVKVGTAGSPSEKGFAVAAQAIGRGADWSPDDPEPVAVPNPNFLRRGYCQNDNTCEGTSQSCTQHSECEDAALFIIFVSDEDDKSFGLVRYFWRLFESYKGPGNESRVKLSAIVGPASDPSSGARGGCFNPGRGVAAPGDRYSELVGLAGGTSEAEGAAQGIITSICEDFNESLTALSINAAGLSAKFKLSSVPSLSGVLPCDPQPGAALCVKVNGTPVPEDTTGNRRGWTYQSDDNAVVFGPYVLPPPQAKITVTYQEARL